MKIIYGLLILGILVPNISNAAQCSGREGSTAKLEWNVKWTKSGPSKQGVEEVWSVEQTMGLGPTLKGSLNLTRTKTKVFANHVLIDGGNPCTYTGNISADTSVIGTYHCSSGGPYNFELECNWK